MKIVLELQNASKTFNLGDVQVEALKKSSLKIHKGEFVAIMGPSGSGKSTLMNLAGCLDTPTSGKVIIDGKDISKLSEKELAKIRNQKIGFVFQTFNLLPRVNALANVELPLFYTGMKRKQREERASQLLAQMGLGDRLRHLPNQLSGGEQQRVAISRALATNPSLIFADEPTGNLDSKTGKEIIEILKKLNKEGNTIVMITHDHDIAKNAHRIIKIKDGLIKKH